MTNSILLQDWTPAGEYRAVIQVNTSGPSLPKSAHQTPDRGGISTIPVFVEVDAFGNPVGSAVVSHTPTVATTAYTANTVVGGPMTFTGVSGAIDSIVVAANSTQTAGFVGYFFSQAVTGTYTDKSAPSMSAADVSHLVGIVPLSPTSTPGLTGNTFYAAQTNIPVANSVAGVVMVLVTTGTPTFSTANNLTVTLKS